MKRFFFQFPQARLRDGQSFIHHPLAQSADAEDAAVAEAVARVALKARFAAERLELALGPAELVQTTPHSLYRRFGVEAFLAA